MSDPFARVIDWEQPVSPQARDIIYAQMLVRLGKDQVLPRRALVSQRVFDAIVSEYTHPVKKMSLSWLVECSKGVWFFVCLELVICPDCDVYVPSAEQLKVS